MDFSFERFTETDASFAARVTVRRTGQFGFGAGAINRFGIHSSEYCVLYYDPQQKAVGLEFTSEKCEGAIEIKKSQSNTYVRAKNFCDRYGIDYSKSHTHKLRKHEKTGFLYFLLEEDKAASEADRRATPSSTSTSPKPNRRHESEKTS